MKAPEPAAVYMKCGDLLATLPADDQCDVLLDLLESAVEGLPEPSGNQHLRLVYDSWVTFIEGIQESIIDLSVEEEASGRREGVVGSP